MLRHLEQYEFWTHHEMTRSQNEAQLLRDELTHETLELESANWALDAAQEWGTFKENEVMQALRREEDVVRTNRQELRAMEAVVASRPGPGDCEEANAA